MPRSSFLPALLSAAWLMFISNAASAVNTSIVSLTEANGGAHHHTISYDYHRDTNDSVWLTFQLSPV